MLTATQKHSLTKWNLLLWILMRPIFVSCRSDSIRWFWHSSLFKFFVCMWLLLLSAIACCLIFRPYMSVFYRCGYLVLVLDQKIKVCLHLNRHSKRTCTPRTRFPIEFEVLDCSFCLAESKQFICPKSQTDRKTQYIKKTRRADNLFFLE